MAALTPALPLPCLTGFCSMAQPLHCAGGAGRGCAGARRGRVSRWLPRFAVAIGLPWPASCPVHWPATGPGQDTPSPCPGLARPSQLMPYCAALPLRPSRLSYPLVLLTVPCRRTDMVEYFGLKLDGYFFTGGCLWPSCCMHALGCMPIRWLHCLQGRLNGGVVPSSRLMRCHTTPSRHPASMFYCTPFPCRARLGAELRQPLHPPAHHCGRHLPPRGELS